MGRSTALVVCEEATVCCAVNKTSDDGCIFTVRPQVLPASHMDTHGTGVLAHAGQPDKSQDAACVCECVAERECVWLK